jgi:hypothetical protein
MRRQDDPASRTATTPYIAWALVVVGITVLDWLGGATQDACTNASESMIERFDLFTIIVVGRWSSVSSTASRMPARAPCQRQTITDQQAALGF